MNNLRDNVVIYSNSELNLKKNMNMNRLRPLVDDNPLTPPASISSLITPSASGEEKDLSTLFGLNGPVMAARPTKTIFGFERISRDDVYVQIDVQVNKLRLDGKYKRAKVYISLKRDTDQRFSIFLASSVTTSLSELHRGMKKKKETVLQMLEILYTRNSKAMIGRTHYKAPRGVKTEDFHRKLMTGAMCSLYQIDNEWFLDLLLIGELYTIPLEKPTNEKQSKVYSLVGSYKNDMEEFDDDEEYQ